MKRVMNRVINRKTVLTVLIVFLCTTLFYAVNRVNASYKNASFAKASAVNMDEVHNETDGEADEAITGKTGKEFGPDDIHKMDKDETIYVNLNFDGTVSEINVVNYFKAQEAGVYIDYGNYVNIINLTNDISPAVTDDSIQWELNDPNVDFYYQGQLSSGEIPWTFVINYKLNGVEVKAVDLPGASGELIIDVRVEENKAAEEYFRKNYMLQLTIPFNMQNSTLISAPGAVRMVTGHTKTLAFTLLPQTSGYYEIKAQVQNFSMDAMDIAVMKADLSAYIDSEEMTKGFNTMSDGMGELADGTVQLQEGMTELSGGINSVSNGLNDLSEGTPKLTKGMDQFSEGMASFAGGLDELSSGSDLMKEGLQGLSDNGEQLLSGYQGVEDGLSSILSMKEEMIALAGEMAGSMDPQTVMLGQTILAQLEGLTELQTGLETLNTGMGQYTQGVTQAAGQYDTLNAGIKALPGGFDQLTQGYQEIKNGNETVYSAVDELSKGLSDINTGAAPVPGQVQKLADGQQDMKEGINQAIEEINSLTGAYSDQEKNQTMSFAAPGKAVTNSVQFVLRTPAIEKAVKQTESTDSEAKKESFWDKLMVLFR